MSAHKKQGGWIKVDKNLRHYLPKDEKPYSVIEAYISFRIDLDEGNRWTVNGYSKLWNWDRKRVRRFTTELGTPLGQFRDTVGTPLGQCIRNIFNELPEERDTVGTQLGQGRDRVGDTTTKTKTETKTKTDKTIGPELETSPGLFEPVKVVEVIAETGNPVITFPLNDKTEYPLTEEQAAEYAELYPAVNVIEELKRMRAWLISNPRERKTRAGILRFVNGWLSKQQDRGGRPAVGGTISRFKTKEEIREERTRRAVRIFCGIEPKDEGEI